MCQVQELGYRYIRVQLGGYGGLSKDIVKPEGAPEGHYFDRKQYMRAALEMFECVRKEVGDEVELLHDVHERLTPIEAVGFARDVEQFKLYFLEDPLAPEDLEWFKNIRQQCATPIAMGESCLVATTAGITRCRNMIQASSSRVLASSRGLQFCGATAAVTPTM